MEERIGDAFAFDELLTVIGRKLLPGEIVPDLSLDYLDLADMTIQSVGLADIEGDMRLFNVVNSLVRPVCHHITAQWEKLRTDLSPGVCIYTISMDSPEAQAHWQSMEGILHQTLSAHRSEQFGQDYGVWLKEWGLLQRAVFVIDCDNRIVYSEYVADQMREPDYRVAIEVIHQASKDEVIRRGKEHNHI